MMRIAGGRLLAAGLMVVAGAGCVSILSPQPDRSKFFVLTPSADSAPPASGAAAGPSIGLGPVRLPPYLDRDEIARRVDPNQVQYSQTDRWAEPLESNFRRVLQRDLAGRLSDAQFVGYPWFRTTSIDYRIEVEVEHFEGNQNGDVNLIADWTIKDGKTGKLLVSQHSAIDKPSKGAASPAVVAALSSSVDELSDQIATAMRGLKEENRR
jgi:uncharacterized lipoprotein YmbA